MRSLHTHFRLGLGAVLVPCAFLAVGCGGGNREALEKRVAGMQDELTRLQNTNDRLAERVQALEIVGMRASKPAAAAEPAAEPEERVARPNLKVVKLAPGNATAAPEPEPAAEEPAPAEEKGPRPVIKDYGARPPAVVRPLPRAPGAPLGQNAGAPRPAPQGT